MSALSAVLGSELQLFQNFKEPSVTETLNSVRTPYYGLDCVQTWLKTGLEEHLW